MGRDRAAREEAKPLRLFVAVDLPPAVDEAVERQAAAWRDRLGAGRWIPGENRHVTVAFLGRTWPRLRGWVEDRVAEAARSVRPFATSLYSVGVFPRASSAGVLWLGLDERDGGWDALARALRDGLAGEFPPDKREFTPHLTLARFQPPIDVRAHAGALAAPLREPSFRVGNVTLFRSHLQRPAPKYEPLRVFRLGG